MPAPAFMTSISASQSSPTPEGLSPLHVWRAARKHWLLVLFVTAAVTAAAVFYALGHKTIYRSTATLLIDPDPPRPLGKDVEKVVDFNAYWSNKEYYATQLEVIRSRQIASEVVHRLGLHHDGGFIENLPPGEKKKTDVTVERAAGVLRSRLAVEPQSKTRLVVVSLEDADPERARRILTAIVDVYIQHNLDEIASSSASAGQWLHDQLQKLKAELEKSELSLHHYKKEKSILSVSYDDQSNMLREEITQLNARITTVRAEREKVSARYKALSSVDLEDPAELPTGELLASPLLDQLRTEYVAAKRERERLIASGKGVNHPDAQSASSSVATLRDALVAELRNIQNGVKKDMDALTHEVNGLSKLYEAAQRRALDLNLLEIEHNRLERLKNNNEKLYSLVLERSKESDLASLMSVNNIRVLDAPLRGAPQGLGVPILSAAGLLVGLFLGLAAAVGREMLDRSLKSAEDLEQELALPVLGMLPKGDGSDDRPYYGKRRRTRVQQSVSAIELSVHEQPHSVIAEAARAIRTNILFMAPDRPYRTLLVTSPGPGDGKTTVACWIAIAMAQAGHRVLLIDCDLRKPRVHKVFRPKEPVGVTDVLFERSLLDKADLSTVVPNLSVLPAGPHVPNPAEVLGSDTFNALLRDLGKRYDRVIIDSPPIAAVTDATILSTRVDGTVLVVRAFSTARDLARRAARAVRDVGGQLVGSVLNAADAGTRGGYYYYQGAYYGDPEREDAA